MQEHRQIERPTPSDSESQSPGPSRKGGPARNPRTAKRTRTGCYTCRARKVKCDEAQPTCQNCKRRMVACKWPVVEDVLATHTRQRKNQPIPRSTSALAGESSSTQDSVPATTVVTGQTKDSNPDLIIDHTPKAFVRQHILAFFTHIYPCQGNGFIHRGNLLRNFQSGLVDRKLLLAICAVASRFVNDASKSTYEPAQAEAWAKEAKTLLILEDMTTDTIAAALLLARHEVNGGDYSSAWMLSSIATRAALALGLNKEDDADDTDIPFSERETRRRLFWACYCLDRMMSTGLSELVVFRTEHICLPLPCEEHQYLFGIPCWTPTTNLEVEMPPTGGGQSQPQGDIGMFGHYVQIMQLRYSILKYVRNHPENPRELPPWDPSSTFAQCVQKMSSWKQSLPRQFQLLPDTVCVRQAQDQLSPLIMLHVWYEQCMTDLYRIAMPGFPETLPDSMLLEAPPGWAREHQEACARHACNIASIFETVGALADMENFVFLDTSLPMCVFESMCVRLQWLFMTPPESLSERTKECEASFTPLIRRVEKMAPYFRQAQWLLGEMRKLLSRHGIHIQITLPVDRNDSSQSEKGRHPWQRRIQGLKDKRKQSHEKNQQNGTAGDGIPNVPRIGVPVLADQNIHQTPVSHSDLAVDDGSQYPMPQNVSFNDMLYDGGLTMGSNGWGEAQVIPGLANFMGMPGGWLANGVEDEPEMDNYPIPR